MMKWIDVTLPIDASYPNWPGAPGFQLTHLTSIAEGDDANSTMLEISSHFGTHIDAPRHFVRDGQTIDAVSLDLLVGPCEVYELQCADAISRSDIAGLDLAEVERVLFKTANSSIIHDRVFHQDYIGLDLSATEFLVEQGIRLVGTDYYSAATYPQAVEVHQLFLGNGGVFVEGLDLQEVAPGSYQLVALPLKIVGVEAAPARVLLGKAGGALR